MANVRDPYLVLGVGPNATEGEIRGAYHDLALRFHPDRTGERDASEFVEVQEAYRLLSDPDERLHYDRTQPRWATYSVRRHIHQFAPDVIVEPAGPHEIIEGMLNALDLTSAGFVHEALHPDLAASSDVHLDLVLSPDEAETGGEFSFTLPVRRRCHACRGAAPMWPAACSVCRGEGTIAWAEQLSVLVPAGVHRGARTVFPLERIGVPNASVDVTVTIEDY
jgi:molecular chaperone DnaJ